MAEPLQPQSLDDLNSKLLEISKQIYPPGLIFKYIAVDDIKEQDINPRSMPQRMFDQLIENVKNTGALESVPLCVQGEDGIYLISGHHRVRAARAAAVKRIVVLLYEELPVSRVRSKQLAHNTISGADDPTMVKRVFEQIIEVQAKFEAYVDPRVFNAIPEPVHFKPVDVDMISVAKTTLVIFLPSQALDFQAAVDAILPKTKIDQIYLAHESTFTAWKEAIGKVREDLDIVSAPTAIAEMARLAMAALAAQEELKDGPNDTTPTDPD